MSDEQTRAVDEALERAQRPLDEYEQWAVGQDADTLRRAFVLSREHAATLAREVERLRGHLERLADAADTGFQRVEDGDSDDPETASEVYQWARNYAYAIRHPDGPMGQALTMRAMQIPASAPGDGPDGRL